MSDHDTPEHDDGAPDPMDQAYVQAEAILDDARARAARRASVLAAVAAESVEAEASPAPRRAAWGRGGWLIAASVVGLSALVALQIRSPYSAAPPAAPSEVAPPPPLAPAAPTARAEVPAEVASVVPRAPGASSAAQKAAPAIAPEQAPAAPAPPQLAPPPLPVPPVEHRIEEPRPPAGAAAPAAAPAASNSEINELVVTAEKRRPPREEKAEQLRIAAEAGQADEVAALLAKGAPVDLSDEAGDTALMKSVRADHPAAAILLRRHGASLDRRNRAGESARDLAAKVGDPELDRALGLKP